MAFSPVWSCVTGDQVTGTVEWVNRKNKKSSFCSRKPKCPCGSAGTGRLLPIMKRLCGSGGSGHPPNSQPGCQPGGVFRCPTRFVLKPRIHSRGCDVQYTESRFRSTCREKA